MYAFHSRSRSLEQGHSLMLEVPPLTCFRCKLVEWACIRTDIALGTEMRTEFVSQDTTATYG
jgi:hypothetical protein